MDTVFKAYKDITEEEYQTLWEKGLFVFDTNVLLDLYRLPESAQKDLLMILSDRKINKRIWLPFQVSLEFIYNKIEAIGDQKNKFNTVREIINESISQINTISSELQKNIFDLQLKKRHSVINPDPYINDELFKTPVKVLNEFLVQLDDLDKKQPDVNDIDTLKQKVSKLFKNKIGEPPTKEILENLYKDGEIRYKDNTPPGYKDKAKEGFYMFEDKKFIRKYGDLILWKEIITKCNDEEIEYIILVTGDIKEDWWQEKRGKKIGPRYELLNELYFDAKSVKLFHMYDTPSFMKYSKEYLKININEQSITETKDLLEFTKYKNSLSFRSNDVIPISECLQREVSAFPNIKLIYPPSNSQYLLISYVDFHLMLLEIFSNVSEHSVDDVVFARGFKTKEAFVLRFRNDISVDNENLDSSRGKGISFITNIMQKYGQVKIIKTPTYFKIALHFRKEYSSYINSIPNDD